MSYQAIADFVMLLIGCGYVYGATGWVCSEARREQQAKQYPEWADNILGVCAKWDGKKCYDCAQLTRAAAKAVGVSLPSGATSQWKADVWEEKGTIDTLPADQTGLMLYRQSGGKMQHTGVAAGDGMAVDARGSKDGVVYKPISSFPWTHWARLRITGGEKVENKVNTEKALYQATVVAQSGGTVRLRESASTKNGKVLVNVPLGSTVDVLEEGGEWRRVRYNGTVGFMMKQYLLAHTSTPVVLPEDVPEVDRGSIEYRLMTAEEQIEQLTDAVNKLSTDIIALKAR